MTSIQRKMLAMTCAAGFFGCGSEVESSGGDSGRTPDGNNTETSAREGGSDGPSFLDAGSDANGGRDGDAGMMADCALLDVSLVGADAAKLASCEPDPCGPAQFCWDWVNMPGSMDPGTPFGQCVDVPAECAPTTCAPAPTCSCVEASQRKFGCIPKSCEEHGGALILTCYFPVPP